MSEKPVLVSIEGRAGRLTLNRPKALHTLTREMCQIMFDAMMAWKDDPAIELVVVDHLADTRGFCAGGDVKFLSASGAKDGVDAASFFELEYNLNVLIKNYPKPYVPIIDGFTMGGGKGIAIFGSHRVATERTVVAMPEGNIGLFPDVGGGWFLPRLMGELGMWMALTGARVEGLDTLATGIATHFVPSDQLDQLKQNLAEEGIAALDALETDAPISDRESQAIINHCFSATSVEGVFSRLDEQSSDWAQMQINDIRTKCPMTVKVAFRQLREGRQAKDFAQWMAMEYRIGSRMCRRADFSEGVRARLIDKDNAPTWSPSRLEDISDIEVEAMFQPLETEFRLFEGVPNP